MMSILGYKKIYNSYTYRNIQYILVIYMWEIESKFIWKCSGSESLFSDFYFSCTIKINIPINRDCEGNAKDSSEIQLTEQKYMLPTLFYGL